MAETDVSLAALQEVQQAPAPRLAWVDLIRVGGAFLVVLAHIILYPSLHGAGPLWAQTLYYASSRIAVPLFFMASGFLLLGKQEPLGTFFRKRGLRVFVPFLIWSFIYIAWNDGFNPGESFLGNILGGLERIVRGPRAAHLWFFYVLIGLYIITPVLRLFAARATSRDFLYFCGAWFLLDPVLSAIQYLTGLKVGFEFQFLTGYIGYFVLGYYLGHLGLTRRGLFLAAALMLLSFVWLFLSIYIGEQRPGYDQFFEGYLSIPVVVLTASAFYLVRALNDRVPQRMMGWILPLSAASLGIYLLHVIVLDIFDRSISPLLTILRDGSSIIMMPAVAIAGYLVCFAVVFLLQKIPVLRYSVP